MLCADLSWPASVRRRLYRVLKPVMELLAGIPSIVYGFFGLSCIVPFDADTSSAADGKSILTASSASGAL